MRCGANTSTARFDPIGSSSAPSLRDGAGGYWTSVGSGCSGQNTVTFAVQVPAKMQLAAFWHTHGAAAPLRELFSPDDVDLVRSTGRDFYLITPRGEIRVLRAERRAADAGGWQRTRIRPVAPQSVVQ